MLSLLLLDLSMFPSGTLAQGLAASSSVTAARPAGTRLHTGFFLWMGGDLVPLGDALLYQVKFLLKVDSAAGLWDQGRDMLCKLQ